MGKAKKKFDEVKNCSKFLILFTSCDTKPNRLPHIPILWSITWYWYSQHMIAENIVNDRSRNRKTKLTGKKSNIKPIFLITFSYIYNVNKYLQHNLGNSLCLFIEHPHNMENFPNDLKKSAKTTQNWRIGTFN